MANKTFCDVCGDELTKDNKGEHNPNSYMIVRISDALALSVFAWKPDYGEIDICEPCVLAAMKQGKMEASK